MFSKWSAKVLINNENILKQIINIQVLRIKFKFH